MNRYANWVKDLPIPAKHDAHQVKGENGGPGGMIHTMLNISVCNRISASSFWFVVKCINCRWIISALGQIPVSVTKRSFRPRGVRIHRISEMESS
jgi:hypothetical protein